MEVLIVGAGCAGLTAAACLAKDGHRVKVLERSSALSTAGGGITVRVAAARVLRQYGLQSVLEGIAQTFDKTYVVDAHSGQALQTIANPSRDDEWSCSRPDYQHAFYHRAIQLGVEVHFDQTVKRLVEEPGQRPVVELRDGTRLTADLVIAADGVRSRLRSSILGQKVEPIVDDDAYYAVRIDASILRQHREAAPLLENDGLAIHVGKEIYVVAKYASRLDRWSALFGVKEQRHGEAFWEEHGDINVARDFFKTASPALRRALELTDVCDRWQLSQLDDLPSWRSKGGRSVLLGDSAHAMQPNAAQGLSQSIEDAAVLSFLVTQTRDVPRATELWQQVRKPRVEKIKAFAATMTRAYLSGSSRGWSKRRRDSSRIADDGPATADARYGSLAFSRWLYEYDALAEAAKLLDSSQQSRARL